MIQEIKKIDKFDELFKDEKQKSGFRKLPLEETCKDPSHYPPMHLYIPPGSVYDHICPACGKKTTLRTLSVTC